MQGRLVQFKVELAALKWRRCCSNGREAFEPAVLGHARCTRAASASSAWRTATCSLCSSSGAGSIHSKAALESLSATKKLPSTRRSHLFWSTDRTALRGLECVSETRTNPQICGGSRYLPQFFNGIVNSRWLGRFPSFIPLDGLLPLYFDLPP